MFLPPQAVDYVDIDGLLEFINEFDGSKTGGAYSFRRRSTPLNLRLEGL